MEPNSYALAFVITSLLLPVFLAILCIFAKGPLAYIIHKQNLKLKRENYDFERHCRLYGIYCLAVSVFLGLTIYGGLISLPWLTWPSFAATCAAFIVWQICMHKSEMFKKR